jgi:hypothetical protein
MTNARQEEKSTQGMEDGARRAGERAVEHTNRIGQAAADQTARVGQAAAQAGEEVAKVSADLLKQNAETLQNTWRSEPSRVCRRPFGLSYAAMADCSSMA